MKIKDQRIDDLERRVNDLKQHSRKRNIIVTGLNVHSYAHAATRTRSTRGSTQTDGEDVSESNEMRKHFVKFAKDKLNVSVEEIEITAIHDLPKRKDGTTPVIVQLLSVDKKTDLMRRRKNLKGSNVFLNDQLTRTNNELFAEARRLKKEGKLYGTWTMNCNIFVKKCSSNVKLTWINSKMARCISVFADISLSVVKFNGLLYDSFVLYCSYSFTLFLYIYHYIIGHVSTIYYHPTI